jgi:hypothetical protein
MEKFPVTESERADEESSLNNGLNSKEDEYMMYIINKFGFQGILHPKVKALSSFTPICRSRPL